MDCFASLAMTMWRKRLFFAYTFAFATRRPPASSAPNLPAIRSGVGIMPPSDQLAGSPSELLPV